MTKKRTTPRTLFKYTPGKSIKNPTAAEFHAFTQRQSPRALLARALDVIGKAAAAARTDSTVPNGADHAERIDEHLHRLESARKTGNPESIAFEAIKLAEQWMMLRIDALFAGDVRAAESQRAKPQNKPSVADSDILTALRAHRRQLDAALAVGISERQIRERIPASVRRDIKKRRSGGLPKR